MKKRITIFIFIIASTIYAQDTIQLSIDECVELALKNNVTMKIANAKVADAKYSKYQSWGSILPKVDLTGFNIIDEKIRPIDNFFYVPGTTPDPSDPLTFLMSEPYLEMDFTQDYQFDLSVTQTIFAGGKILNGIRLANTNSNIEVLSNEIEKREMIYKAVQTYFGVLVARQYNNVASEAYKMASDFYNITEIMYEQGMVSKLDLLQADVQVSNLLPQKTKAENAVQLAESGLKVLTGIEDSYIVELSDQLEYYRHEYSYQQLQKEALANRLELQQMDLRQNMGKYGLAMARSNYLPMIALTGSYSKFGNDIDNYNKWGDFYTIALGLNFNIFNGGGTHTNIQKAKVALKQIKWGTDGLKDGIKMEVEQAFLKLESAEKNLLSQEKTVNQAEESVRIAKLQYKEGLITNLQANQIQISLTTAKVNYIQAIFEYTLANISIRKATGKELLNTKETK